MFVKDGQESLLRTAASVRAQFPDRCIAPDDHGILARRGIDRDDRKIEARFIIPIPRGEPQLVSNRARQRFIGDDESPLVAGAARGQSARRKQPPWPVDDELLDLFTLLTDGRLALGVPGTLWFGQVPPQRNHFGSRVARG